MKGDKGGKVTHLRHRYHTSNKNGTDEYMKETDSKKCNHFRQ